MGNADSFVRAVNEFVSWSEQPNSGATSEARSAHLLLARLYSLAVSFEVPTTVDFSHDGSRISDVEWRARYDRFSGLPFGYYGEVSDPLEPLAESTVGDIADDLADIYRDLMIGLSLERAGRRPEALHSWKTSFEIHWGTHALSALRALHRWLQKEAEW